MRKIIGFLSATAMAVVLAGSATLASPGPATCLGGDCDPNASGCTCETQFASTCEGNQKHLDKVCVCVAAVDTGV